MQRNVFFSLNRFSWHLKYQSHYYPNALYLITDKRSPTVSHSASSGETNHMDSSRDEQPKELPFQVQITYTDLDGAQALRLIAKAKPVTRDRAVAEKRKFFCGKLIAN